MFQKLREQQSAKLLTKAVRHFDEAAQLRRDWWIYRTKASRSLFENNDASQYTDGNFSAYMDAAYGMVFTEASMVMKIRSHIRRYNRIIKRVNRISRINDVFDKEAEKHARL